MGTHDDLHDDDLHGGEAALLRERLAADLDEAQHHDDRTRAAALQSALLAIDNVRAGPPESGGGSPNETVAGATSVTDAAAGERGPDGPAVTDVLANEIRAREQAAADRRSVGDDAHADQIEREIDVLRRYLDGG